MTDIVNDTDIRRLTSAKKACIDHGLELGFRGSLETGGVVYIMPNQKVEDVSKYLMMLAAQLHEIEEPQQ